MNTFKAIYWNQYYELKQKGKGHVARKQGTLLVTIAITLFIFSIFFLLMVFLPDFEKDINRFLRKSFGRNSGRALGKIGAALLILLIYPIINFTIGSSKKYHDYIVKSSLLLSPDEQKTLSKKGMKIFISSVILFGIVMIILLIKTFIL